MSLLDDIIFGFSGRPTEEGSEPILGILGFVFWIVVIIGATFGGFIIIRMAWLKFAYEGGIEIAPYRFIWMGKYGEIEGNLSLNDSFDDETMDGLEQHTDLRFVKSIVKDQIKNGELFVYNFKITDEGDILEDFAKKVRIISPADITLPKYTWLDSRGKRNLGSILRREKRRNVVCYHTSRRETVFDEDGHEIEYWIISPLPMVDAKHAIGFNGKPLTPTPAHFIDVIKIEGGKKLAEIATLAPILAEALKKYLHVKAERDNYAKLYDDEVEKNQQINMEKEELKHKLSQKIYVGLEPEPEIPKAVMTAGWIAITSFVTGLLIIILPDFLPSLDFMMAQLIGMGVGMGIMVMGFAYIQSKQSETKQKKVESRA
jgi:hypothetical protein